MPEPEYDGLAIVDGDNIVRGVQRLVHGSIHIEKFTVLIREQLQERSTQNPLLIWCHTVTTSDPRFPSRRADLERNQWRVCELSGGSEVDQHTGARHWYGLPDSFIAQEARLAMIKYRMRNLLLASGDGYFIDLIRQAREHHVHTIVLSLRNSLHRDLCAAADEIIELDKYFGTVIDSCAPSAPSVVTWAKTAQRIADSRYPLIGRPRSRWRR